MDIRRCYQILDLSPHASLSQVKQAYLDMVRVWHPDRFGDDLRLRQKAEEKLKEANIAYACLCRQLSPEAREAGPKDPMTPNPGRRNTASRTEALAEAGTRAVLSALFLLRSVVRDALERPAQGKGDGP